MRVVLDFQACQSGSRYRGIGRGSRALMLAMANRLMSRGHEVVCLLSEAFSDGLHELRDDIRRNAPGARLTSFRIPSPCAAGAPENAWRQMAARILREHAIACLEPDFVHVPALLADGWGDDSVGSVGMLGVHIPTSLTQHDLIPLVMADEYMPEGPFRDYYMRKLADAKKADLLLAISEYSRSEAIEWMAMPPDDVVHISSATDACFLEARRSSKEIAEVLARIGVSQGFIFYAPGGFDVRKNMKRLLEAYAILPTDVRSRHQLVVASMIDESLRKQLTSIAAELGLRQGEFVMTGYVPDHELICLYQACTLYVFPSLHEGFGLPVLEAMAAGAPVIASNCSCIPEVVGLDEALFDPYSVESMSGKMLHGLRDGAFRARVKVHGEQWHKQFSWERSAAIAVEALEKKAAILREGGWAPAKTESLPACDQMLEKINDLSISGQSDLECFRQCFEANSKSKLN
ncbi:glycosyltransferase family 1 protein [Uliginosibacterium sp. 31-12]|uniref:glycosyltransferase family 4 protein n=1 Tax=Uliginosibacterium sp. 31-12 TaxID=3062781 RepID=UPI0026E1C6DF|nr:glycosyltransferase family 1 protein [Uliginosibacterium sp. 31-12]MDO6388166.1 glycosyltransferase family 1 protein [Uliginosibacterium sp. 31-12]